MGVVVDAELAESCGVPHARALLALADASIVGSDESLESARGRILSELGPEALADAAAVVANFQRMNRISDATGIPLDGIMGLMTADLRSQLGVERFGSAANTPSSGALKRGLAWLLRPILRRAMRLGLAAGNWFRNR